MSGRGAWVSRFTMLFTEQADQFDLGHETVLPADEAREIK